MKEKIKNSLFCISIFYSIMILVLIIFNINSMVTAIDLSDSEKNKSKLQEYKNMIANFEPNSCTNVINEIIDYYESTSYDGEVKLRYIYNQDSLLKFFTKVKDNCNLTDDDIEDYHLPTKFLASSIFIEELFQPYYFQYELTVKNSVIRNFIEPAINNTEYALSKSLQLELISDLIEIVNMEEHKNE